MNTIEDLRSIEVPKGLLSYSQITESVSEKLKSFTGEDELFIALNMSKKGDAACGTICSPKIALGIHWTYSYNRSIKFSLSLVAYGKSSNLVYTTSDVKIHTIPKATEHSEEDLNTALTEIFAEISDGVAKTKLTTFRKKLLEKTISFRQAYIFASDLYFNAKFLSPTQLSAYQSEIENLRGTEGITVWDNFCRVVKAIEDGNPKLWMKDSRELSELLEAELKSFDLVVVPDKPSAEKAEQTLDQITIELEEVCNRYLNFVGSEESEKKSFVESLVSGDKVEEKEVETEQKIVPVDLSKPVKIIPPKKEEVVVEAKEEAPKKGLGLFSKLTETVVSENTGKTKKVISSSKLSEEQIEAITEEREEKAQKMLFVSDELVDEEVVEEIQIEETLEDSDLIDEFEIPEAEDFEDIELPTESVEPVAKTKTEVVEDDDDDFGLNDTEVEHVDSLVAFSLVEGKTPSNTIKSGSVTAYVFEKENLTLVAQN